LPFPCHISLFPSRTWRPSKSGLFAPRIPLCPFLPNTRPRFVSASVLRNPGAGRLHGQIFDGQREIIRFHQVFFSKKSHQGQIFLLIFSKQEQLRKFLMIVDSNLRERIRPRICRNHDGHNKRNAASELSFPENLLCDQLGEIWAP
jgi:hypothetical protein